ncbi:hypothetical protein BXZ70DRAFT_955686 [Cristinia sonorae]|uniref:Uncharacterized protein n=1 Tax=Cristinia sonorae TaxID=1940300 RepID=A0A8K0UH22_9AGAR|nr:hypothetical protein BXZ70DRAFT_955686 [Cristinia sonorae]
MVSVNSKKNGSRKRGLIVSHLIVLFPRTIRPREQQEEQTSRSKSPPSRIEEYSHRFLLSEETYVGVCLRLLAEPNQHCPIRPSRDAVGEPREGKVQIEWRREHRKKKSKLDDARLQKFGYCCSTGIPLWQLEVKKVMSLPRHALVDSSGSGRESGGKGRRENLPRFLLSMRGPDGQTEQLAKVKLFRHRLRRYSRECDNS